MTRNRQFLGVKALAGLQERRISVAPVLWMERAAFADLAADDLAAPERDGSARPLPRFTPFWNGCAESLA